MGILGKLTFWKKSKVSAVQPVILEETPEEPREVSWAPRTCLQQETIREEEVLANDEGAAPAAPGSSRSPAEARAKSKQEPQDVDTRTPSPSECGELDCLNFDAKSEQTFAGITKEFGHMIGSSLQSSKWHRRAEALKSMMQVLQGMDLQGMAPPGSTGVLRPGIQANSDPRRWRLTCQLLNQVMRDKVMPVRLASLELFEVAFGDLHYLEKAEVAYAAGVLVEHLIDRLGDSNLRLHEAARRAVVFTAQKPGLLGLKEVISRLRARLGVTSERTKVHFGVLDTVSVLLDTVGEAEWNAEEVAPFVLAGMDDSLGPRVRTAAVQLAARVYAARGPEAVEPMLSQLRPAKQALLRSKFQEMDEEDEQEDGEEGEERPDLDGLLVCTAAVAPPIELETSLSGEEGLMDGILEEAGMVFQGQGIVNEDPDKELDDSWLEEELLGYACEIEELDEQQALMSSLLENQAKTAGRGKCHQSELSVEVF